MREIFGYRNISAVASAESEGAVSTSGYKLLATSVGTIKMALILSGSKVYVLREGEEFEGGVVSKIEKDYVLLSTPYGNITVKFPESLTSVGSSAGSVKTTIKREGNTVVISRRELERLTSDPGVMFNQVRLVPYLENGRTKGFKFEWIKPGSLLSKAGLRPGDILVAINNMQITSGEDAFRLLQVLRNETSFKISILRNGKEVDLTLRVE